MPARLPKRSSKKTKGNGKGNGKGKTTNTILQPGGVPIDYSNPPEEHKRSRLEREEEAFKILNTMIETGFTVTKYPCLQVLINHIYNYIHNSVRIELNIPLPDIDRTVTGVLATDRRERVVVCLKAGVISSETHVAVATSAATVTEDYTAVAAASATSSVSAPTSAPTPAPMSSEFPVIIDDTSNTSGTEDDAVSPLESTM